MAFGLPLGTRITTKFNKELRVVRRLGSRSQSIVYEVLYDGRPMALKWYSPNAFINRQLFIDNLRNKILCGRPTENFLWPQDIQRGLRLRGDDRRRLRHGFLLGRIHVAAQGV